MRVKRLTKRESELQQREAIATREIPSPFCEKIKQVWEIIAEMKEEARRQGVDREFSADGRLLGDVGEILANKYFGVKLHTKQKKGQDGSCLVSGKTVEVKLRAKSTLVIIRGIPDILLVVYLSPTTLKWGVVCNGSGIELLHLAKAELKGDYHKTSVNALIEAQKQLTTNSGIAEISR